MRNLQKNSQFNWSSVPSNLCILVLEVFLFQATLSIFISEHDLRISHHNFTEVYWLLTQINPPSNRRIDQSPFYAGFYDLFAILYEIILLHRSSHTAEISPTRVNALEKQISEIQSTVRDTVFEKQIKSTTQLVNVVETFNFYCAALLICVNALKAPSGQRDFRIAAGVQIGLKILHDKRLFMGNNHSLLWPIQVLRCAINSPADVIAFDLRFNELRGCFYGVSLERSESLFRRVHQIDQRPIYKAEQRLRFSRDDDTIPRGMLLFRQKGGVLAQEF